MNGYTELQMRVSGMQAPSAVTRKIILKQCESCAAVVPNDDKSMSAHTKWHVVNGR